jgi:hypothetical protein
MVTKPKNQTKAAGGIARAQKLAPAAKTAIAKKAAAARWGERPARAIHKGNFMDEFGIDVECYVLQDEKKTAVISQIGMGKVLGLSSRGNSFPRFLASQAMSKHVGAELKAKLEKPLKFQWAKAGAGQQPSTVIHGFDATLLIDVCQAIIRAEKDLKEHQRAVVKQASIILGASAKAGIEGLVYALAGYDRTKEEVIAAYKMYVAEEAREYEREFSPELYEQWYRLYGLEKPERGRPWEFRYLTIDHIYKPLAKSNGKVFNLAKSSKQANGEKGDKIHQFLSEIGVKALRTQVGKITGIATVSESREEYERYIAEKIHGQASFDFSKTSD